MSRSGTDLQDDMYKVRRLLASLAALVIAICLSLVVASAGAAATVTRTLLTNSGTEPFYGGNCGFPLTATFTGQAWMTAVEKNDGTLQLIFTPVIPSRITVTNPANGKSLTSLQYAAGEVIVITDSSFSDHFGGIIWNFVVPGSGPVLQWIGMNNFVTGAFSGRFTSDTTAFCDYLAGS
jgi:hypothetical protein